MLILEPLDFFNSITCSIFAAKKLFADNASEDFNDKVKKVRLFL